MPVNNLQEALNVLLTQKKYDMRDIADHFEVAMSTIQRWKQGLTAPAKLIENQIIDLANQR